MELSRMKLGPATTYALAVANGYTGTLEQWLAEQKGEPGTTPHIGANGNWYIGTVDTGVKAAGADGTTPHIGANGNWWIEDTDTGFAAEGQAATIEIVGTETLEAGQPAAVEEAEGSTAQARKYIVKVPKGKQGESATVEITGIETLEPGQSATLTELEDSTAAHRKYKMGVPQGQQGPAGAGVPTPTAEDAGKVPTVNADGTGYELETVSGGGSGETIIAEETVLASGTIATGTAANSFSTTGVTIGDLRKWKYFTVEVKSTGQSTYWSPAHALGGYLSRIQHNNIKFQFEWIDSARTVLRVFYAAGTGYEYGTDDITGSITNSTQPAAQKQGKYSRVAVADDVILGIINYDALTVDALWRVKGVLKYGD